MKAKIDFDSSFIWYIEYDELGEANFSEAFVSGYKKLQKQYLEMQEVVEAEWNRIRKIKKEDKNDKKVSND